VRLIALLTISRPELERARGYEHAMARIMARHGGRIEHAYELPGDAATLRELHVVEFPDQAAFDAYQADPERAAHAADRTRAILATEVWPAKLLPRYGD
jgi:uncharacterized protein (DUF1330 family)